MNRARKRFLCYAMLSIFVLLTVLLGIINVASISMAGDDADRLTERLAEGHGKFKPVEGNVGKPFDIKGGRPEGAGPTGPDSPEMPDSLRYFAFSFDEEGNSECIEMKISAVTEEEALSWAEGLLDEPATGWTAATYRYRVFEDEGRTYVIVIDVGRELLPSFRILIISGIGLVAGMLIGYLFLMFIGNMLFKPLEDIDRRQKIFISEVEKEFRTPLAVISDNTEALEKTNGESPETQSINRQIKKLTALVDDVAATGGFDDSGMTIDKFDLSAVAAGLSDEAAPRFEAHGKSLVVNTGEGILMNGDEGAIRELLKELTDNAFKFSETKAQLDIEGKGSRITIRMSSDTELADQSADQVFDRFTMLENAKSIPGAGLGLSKVKDIVKAHNGRVHARVEKGMFIVTVNL
ncbi:MAG: hypothetical protein K5929_02455 [Lachnospiraceae bacterium]|nr:hypothetical protein [Lachnospiraceae bacterium]